MGGAQPAVTQAKPLPVDPLGLTQDLHRDLMRHQRRTQAVIAALLGLVVIFCGAWIWSLSGRVEGVAVDALRACDRPDTDPVAVRRARHLRRRGNGRRTAALAARPA